jgi:hypothetical protein
LIEVSISLNAHLGSKMTTHSVPYNASNTGL